MPEHQNASVTSHVRGVPGMGCALIDDHDSGQPSGRRDALGLSHWLLLARSQTGVSEENASLAAAITACFWRSIALSSFAHPVSDKAPIVARTIARIAPLRFEPPIMI